MEKQKKDAMINLRCTPKLKELVKKKADSEGLSITQYVFECIKRDLKSKKNS